VPLSTFASNTKWSSLGRTDAAGAQWKVSHIVNACALVSIFIMGGFVLLAWMRSAAMVSPRGA